MILSITVIITFVAMLVGIWLIFDDRTNVGIVCFLFFMWCFIGFGPICSCYEDKFQKTPVTLTAIKPSPDRLLFLLPDDTTKIFTDATTVIKYESGQEVEFVKTDFYNAYGHIVHTDYQIQ